MVFSTHITGVQVACLTCRNFTNEGFSIKLQHDVICMDCVKAIVDSYSQLYKIKEEPPIDTTPKSVNIYQTTKTRGYKKGAS